MLAYDLEGQLPIHITKKIIDTRSCFSHMRGETILAN